MKAIVIPQRNGKFQIVEVPTPEPREGEVRIKVEACGVCSGENVAIRGHWPGVSYPRIPGHEIIGRVDRVGLGVPGYREGQRVGVGWSGGGELVTGLTRDGGYAEYAVADARALVSIPDDLDATTAAPLMCAGVTVFSALRRSAARMGDLVAIQGIGGLGHLAIQYARKAGFRTVAISRGKQKERLARELGAHEYIDAEAEDPVQPLKAMGGARVVLATAPSAKAISSVVGGLARDGEIIIVAGSGESLDVTPIQLLGRASIRGWVGDGPPDIVDTVRFSVLTASLPRVEAFPLERAQDAFDAMMRADVRFRAVLVP